MKTIHTREAKSWKLLSRNFFCPWNLLLVLDFVLGFLMYFLHYIEYCSEILVLICSCTKEKLRVHPNLNMMMIQLLVRSDRCSELALFVTDKV